MDALSRASQAFKAFHKKGKENLIEPLAVSVALNSTVVTECKCMFSLLR